MLYKRRVRCPLNRRTPVLKIGILLGDDIGLEVVPETVKVMKAAAAKTGLEVEWREFSIGRKGDELHGNTMPQSTGHGLTPVNGWIPCPVGPGSFSPHSPPPIIPPRRHA